MARWKGPDVGKLVNFASFGQIFLLGFCFKEPKETQGIGLHPALLPKTVDRGAPTCAWTASSLDGTPLGCRNGGTQRVERGLVGVDS